MSNYTETFNSVNGDTVDASELETQFDNIASAIATKLDSDGSGAMTGALNMGSNKVTSVTDPTNDQDAATKAYVDSKTATLTASQTLSNASRTYDFTGIPATATVIHILFSNATVNGSTDEPQIRLGDAGGVESSGYTGAVRNTTGGSLTTFSGSWQLVNGQPGGAADWQGVVTLTLVDASTNTWVSTWNMATDASGAAVHDGSGRKALSATLDRVQIGLTGSTDDWSTGVVAVNYQ